MQYTSSEWVWAMGICQYLVVKGSLGSAINTLWMVCERLRIFVSMTKLKIATSRSLRPLSYVSAVQKGPQPSSRSAYASLLSLAFQFLGTTKFPFKVCILRCLEFLVKGGIITVIIYRRWHISLYDGEIKRSCYKALTIFHALEIQPHFLSFLFSTDVNLCL